MPRYVFCVCGVWLTSWLALSANNWGNNRSSSWRQPQQNLSFGGAGSTLNEISRPALRASATIGSGNNAMPAPCSAIANNPDTELLVWNLGFSNTWLNSSCKCLPGPVALGKLKMGQRLNASKFKYDSVFINVGLPTQVCGYALRGWVLTVLAWPVYTIKARSS